MITLLPASPRDSNPPHSQAEKHLTVKICINNAANWRKTSFAVLLQFLGDQDRPSMVGMDTDGAGSSSSDDSKSTAAFSLVKYENPEIIDIDDEPDEKDGESCEEILNSILPPREWEHNGKLWRQSVSASPATRLDVMNLQEQLDHKLQQRQARETGICQVRRELYSQCFDELIRQSTINCVERGGEDWDKHILWKILRTADAEGERRTEDDSDSLPDSLRVQHCLRNQESFEGRTR